MTEGLRTKDIPVTIADNATLPALIEEQMSPVRILCTDILFTAEDREWLKEIIELNKIGKNILLLCMCRKSLHAQVTQTALLTECKVQVVSVVSFSSAKRRMYECLKLGNVLFPNSKLTLNERRVIKMFLIGMSAHSISRVMNIPLKTVYSIKARALRRFNVSHLNRLYYLRDTLTFN